MVFFHESGDHTLLSPGGNEEVDPPELFTRGADATLRLVLPDSAGAAGAAPSEEGAKAAPPFRLDARRKAVLLVDNLIAPNLFDGEYGYGAPDAGSD